MVNIRCLTHHFTTICVKKITIFKWIFYTTTSLTNADLEFRRVVISNKGKGLGRETIKLVIKISFEQLNAHRLWLDVRYKNKRAQNLYKSEGFIEEGILRECILYNGHYESLILMSVLKNEYTDNIDS